ncbi:MAG: glycosyltransferase [Dietzia psychralcaliphila]
MNAQYTVSIFVSHFVPGWKAGGPIRTVLEMIRTAPPGLRLTIITSDRDLGDTKPYPDLNSRKTILHGARVLYTNWRSPRNAFHTILGEIKKNPDLVILNSFFALRSSTLPIILRSVGALRGNLAIGPRGEFSPGAISIKSRKKLFYIKVMRHSPAVRHATWIATSELEESDIKRIFPEARVVVVPDSRGTIPSGAISEAAKPVRLVFLSRVSPKKNLSGALFALQNVPPDFPVRFDIYGTIEDRAYWAECERAISRLPDHVKASYKGEVRPDQTLSVFANYDAFLFPTRGENFGHVIHEALSQGCPLIITDTTPWSGLIVRGGGILCSEASDIAAAVERIAMEDAEERTHRKQMTHQAYSDWWIENGLTSSPPLELILKATR